MCDKVKHKTEHAAHLHIAALVKSKRYSGKKLHTYFCTECQAYHITQMNQHLAKKKLKRKRGIW